MDADFLGSGIAFPPTLAPGGRVALAAGEEKVRQSIRLILATSPGERPMRPDFGCGINDLVFTRIDRSTLTKIEGSVRTALIRFEPRIDVLGVAASHDPKEPSGSGMVLVTIDYRIRATNTTTNLVWPFHLDGGR